MRSDDVPPSAGARTFAWTGALLFVFSLGYFLFTYAVTFGETGATPAHRDSPIGGGWAAPLTIDLALFTTFALHHSVFARERIRGWVAALVPPRLERATYVWIASLLFIAVCAWWQPLPGAAWRLDDGWRWLGYSVQAAGAWLTVRSAAVIDAFDLAGIRQLRPAASEDPAHLREIEFKTTGPYGWVRHPIYSGWFLVVFAAPTMTMTRLAFAVISGVYLLAAIPFEERSLRRSAGAAYERYLRDVRWRLIPRVY